MNNREVIKKMIACIDTGNFEIKGIHTTEKKEGYLCATIFSLYLKDIDIPEELKELSVTDYAEDFLDFKKESNIGAAAFKFLKGKSKYVFNYNQLGHTQTAYLCDYFGLELGNHDDYHGTKIHSKENGVLMLPKTKRSSYKLKQMTGSSFRPFIGKVKNLLEGLSELITLDKGYSDNDNFKKFSVYEANYGRMMNKTEKARYSMSNQARRRWY